MCWWEVEGSRDDSHVAHAFNNDPTLSASDSGWHHWNALLDNTMSLCQNETQVLVFVFDCFILVVVTLYYDPVVPQE
jgi:hypothetical protein